jgi:uncharacterized protein
VVNPYFGAQAVKLTRFADIHEFYPKVEGYLLAQEAEHNLLLGLSSNLMHGNDYAEPPYLAMVEDGGEIVAVTLRTPPYNQILSQIKNTDAIRLIAEDVCSSSPNMPGVNGAKAHSRAFAECWHEMTGQPYHLKMSMRCFKLEVVRHPRGVPGEMRAAVPAERDLMVEWAAAFNAEALGITDRADAESAMDRFYTRSDGRGLRVWYDGGEPVSVAAFMGPTPHGIRVGYVYTPPEKRGHGYASACVAALSQEQLDSGRKFCFLYTDLSNPTSNHIYQTIGYEPVSDVDQYRFGDKA